MINPDLWSFVGVNPLENDGCSHLDHCNAVVQLDVVYSARYVRRVQSFAGSRSMKANCNRLFRLQLCFLLLIVKSTMARHSIHYYDSAVASAQWVV